MKLHHAVRLGRRSMVAFVAAAALAASLLAVAGCRRGDTYPGAPVILISIDTLRSDHLGIYGSPLGTSPHLDALARDGILFERAYSHYPLTLPSHTTLLTGELPPVTGVRDNTGYPFDPAKHVFLPTLLAKAGYHTGAAVSTFVLRKETGLGKGFEYYDSDLHPKLDELLAQVQRPGAETARIALDWVRARAKEEKPFFCFLHLYEPHSPYEPPEPFASRFKDPYDGEIATADDVVGRFVDELKKIGVYDRAVIVLLSDHGEGLEEHGESQHGFYLYRETLQVPMMLKLPGSPRKGTRVAAPVQLVDVAPTILALAGVDVPKSLTGRSLLQTAEHPEAPPRQLYAETYYGRLHYGWSELTSLIEGRLHLIDGPTPELFDLAKDSGETRNVLEQERRGYATMHAVLARVPHELAAPAAPDAETARQLQALGYAAGSSSQQSGPRPDPRTKRQVLRDLGEAVDAASNGHEAEAVQLYADLLAREPQMGDTWFMYGRVLEHMGRKDEAAKAYVKAMEVAGTQPETAVVTASKLVDLGQVEEGEKLARTMLHQKPERAYEVLSKIAVLRHDVAGARELLSRAEAEHHASEEMRREVARTIAESGDAAAAAAILLPMATTGEPPTLNLLGIALSDSGRQQEALGVLQHAVAADPKNAVGYQSLGMVALRMEQPQQARDYLQKALALNDKLPLAWNTLGVARYQLEGAGPAIDAWQRSVALDPQQFDAWFNIGLVAAESGRRADAQAALRRFVSSAPPAKFAADIQKAQGILRELGG